MTHAYASSMDRTPPAGRGVPQRRSVVSLGGEVTARGAAPVRSLGVVLGMAIAIALGGAAQAQAQTALADQPLFSTSAAPGNMALAMSVEYPTAVSAAHVGNTYSSSFAYLGYYDPDRCYTYNYSASDSTLAPNAATPASYFTPANAATNHLCSGQWSGNFLNWATMQTIDTFRWVMTGGYRVIDLAATTVLEKAWASGQDGTGEFPDRTLPAADIAGATPFGALNAPQMAMRIQGLGNKMRFSVGGYNVQYFNSTTLSGSAVLTRTENDFSSIQTLLSPGPGVSAFSYSARYTTTVVAPSTGSYRFQTLAADGVRVYVNNVLVVDDWPFFKLVATPASGTRSFNAGDILAIRIEYKQVSSGIGTLDVQWQPPGALLATPLPTGDVNTTSSLPPFDGVTPTTGTTFEVFTRTKVCDTAANAETNCKGYGSNRKPEGLMQQYSDKLRYSVFSYLNDSDVKRGGGVLRARQKFIGPTVPVYGSSPVVNPISEWSSSTGIAGPSPDFNDASTTNVMASGALNYVNKFGELKPGNYKGYDPVSELYYAVVRYFRHIGNVSEWSDVSALTAAQQLVAIDGFPVITAWDDPILYSCQKNFILGIGDVNTHADKNVPGNINPAQEPALPAAIASDPSQYLPYDQRFANAGGTALTPFTSTNKVGQIELASGGTYFGAPLALGSLAPYGYGQCCNFNSALIAGMAYDIHTTGIRPFDATKGEVAQTVDTYWVDVLENQTYRATNQYWLAAKYGGFTVPTGFQPYAANPGTLLDSQWTNGDTLYGQKRPRNYFSGGDPATMRTGLTTAFADATSKLPTQSSSSLVTSSPQVATSGTGSYGASYTSSTWSGDVIGSSLVFDALGNPTLTQRWTFNALLTAQAAANGTGWSNNRRIVTWNGSIGVRFLATGPSAITSAQLAQLDTNYGSGNDSVSYLNYLRGDRSLEISTTAASASRVYRTRAGLVGDIVNSKPVAVGVPAFPYSDAANPGYAAFKTKWASRRTVIYVGASDGMLHAINGALVPNSAAAANPTLEADDQAGTEMFAYIPAALFAGPTTPTALPAVNGLNSLGNPSFSHHYMVDGSPANYDVDFGKTAGATSTTPDWRTVLIGGLGKGGRSYYALDITDPQTMVSGGEATVASKVLWEYSEPQSLGYTYGEPIVAKTRKYGWVAILPSGYNNGDGNGHLIVLNIKTGALLQKIDLGSGGAAAGLAHADSFILDSTDGTVDSVYAGDLGGNLWRVDLTSATAAAYPVVRLATLTDSNNVPQPITVRPTLKVDPTTSARRRFVMVGTGRLLDASDIGSTQVQSFYAIVDGSQSAFNASATNGITFPISRSGLVNITPGSASTAATLTGTTPVDLTSKAGYDFDLSSNASQSAGTSRVTLEATTLNGLVAFASSQPNNDVCNPNGTSSLYGLDFSKGLSFLTTTTVPNPNNNTAITSPVASIAYASTATNVTFFSANGTGALNIAFATGNPVNTQPPNPALTAPRRVNWRELPAAD